MGTVIRVADAGAAGRASAGGKAATLGVLAAAGMPVPDGFVVTAEAFDAPEDLDAAVAAAAAPLGDGPFAVRSSAVAEDTAEASFAGLYESYLNVSRRELPAAVRRCHASAAAARVTAYQPGQQHSGPASMAVLVQVMVPAESAGVAFTANPVTGDRNEVIVTAVRGLGERLVGGQAVGDEWVATRDSVERRRDTEHAIDARQARAVADLARQVEALMGGPQDVEWAISGGRLALLQARPMTALPDPVDWTPPGPGLWVRNFRLGEWLPDPMTPLFADWLLQQLDEGFEAGVRSTAGAGLDFPHAAVNGWYYTTAHPTLTPKRLLRAIARSRGRLLWFLYHAIVQPGRRPQAADRALLGRLHEKWNSEMLPAYRQLVAAGEAEVDTAPASRLAALVDEVGLAAGQHLWYLAVIGGSAWKMEAALARFARRHLSGILPDGVAVLLRGLHDPAETPPHAVSSIDWYHPTAGERGGTARGTLDPGRQQRLRAERAAAERACTKALARDAATAARYAALLHTAQRYAVIREKQAGDLTLGWPLLRRAVSRLGQRLHADELIHDPADAYFLTRAELTAPQASLTAAVTARRSAWQWQQRLPAPLTLGTAPPLMQLILDKAGLPHAPNQVPTGAIAGQPASPGRVTGPARILHAPDEADRLAPGDVLVAPATAPAWTPLFAIAAAVVTDGGTLAAHASLVAREYGIPAIVGTGNATTRLQDGQVITVDGTTGLITPATARP